MSELVQMKSEEKSSDLKEVNENLLKLADRTTDVLNRLGVLKEKVVGSEETTKADSEPGKAEGRARNNRVTKLNKPIGDINDSLTYMERHISYLESTLG